MASDSSGNWINPDSFSITDLVTSAVPEIVKAGVNIAGNAIQNDAMDDAKDRYVDNSMASAARLNEGYDEALKYYTAGTDDLYGILDKGYADARGEMIGGMEDYAGITRDATDAYGNAIRPEYVSYSNMLTDSGNEAGDLYQMGADEITGAYDPYMESGSEALSYLNQAMNTDPSRLTPSQQLALENYRRDAIARLAKSGLRGAGRAGVAAVNQGDATLNAQFYDQNQRRSDAAAQTLNSQGFGATGTSAGAQAGAKQAQAGIVLNTGGKIADTGLSTAKDIAAKTLEGERAVATGALNTTNNLTNLATDYYGGKSNLSAGLTNAKVDVAKGKATSDAAAMGNISNIDYLTNIKTADATGDAITNSLLNDKKKIAAQSAAAK